MVTFALPADSFEDENIEYDSDGIPIAFNSPRSSEDENIEYDSDGIPIAFNPSRSSEVSECIGVAAPNTMKSASSPPASFAKVEVPTRQDRAGKGLLTSTLTAAISLFRPSGESSRPRWTFPPQAQGVVFTSVRAPETLAIEQRKRPWVCDNCGTTNQPFDGLCWFCKTHTRCAMCTVPDEDDHDLDLPAVESRFSKLTLLNMPLTKLSDFTARLRRKKKKKKGSLSLLRGKGDEKTVKSSPTVKVSGVNALSTYY